MEQVLSGEARRKKIVDLLKTSPVPLSGTALGKETGVSRQVVVQDMALLRTQGYDIVATPRGYVLDAPTRAVRIIKVCHSNEEIEAELNTIVDLGGCVEDVMVNHRVYGKICAPLNVRNRRDVQGFVNNIRTGKSTSLLNITSGYHFHRISADSEEILDEIGEALKESGMLAEILPYERELIEI